MHGNAAGVDAIRWPKRFVKHALMTTIVVSLSASALSQTLTYGLGGNYDQVDPNLTTFTRVGRMTLHVVEPLVWQPTAGVFEPSLATS